MAKSLVNHPEVLHSPPTEVATEGVAPRGPGSCTWGRCASWCHGWNMSSKWLGVVFGAGKKIEKTLREYLKGNLLIFQVTKGFFFSKIIEVNGFLFITNYYQTAIKPAINMHKPALRCHETWLGDLWIIFPAINSSIRNFKMPGYMFDDKRETGYNWKGWT